MLGDWKKRLPPDAVFVGVSAALVHGLDLGRDYVEVAVPPASGVRSRRGLVVRHIVFPPEDVVTVKNQRVPTLHRTLRDICVSEPAVEALIAIDMALRLRKSNKDALREYVARAAGLPGVKRLRRLVELAAPADSPMETRLRWLLHCARLPVPEVQVKLYDTQSRFVGRADLLYRDARLVIEYDGGNHRDRLVPDDQRQNLIMNAGYRVLRFTATDIYNRPEVVVAQVRGSLVSPPGFRGARFRHRPSRRPSTCFLQELLGDAQRQHTTSGRHDVGRVVHTV